MKISDLTCYNTLGYTKEPCTCGGTRYVSTEILLSYPLQYRARCKSCGAISYVSHDEIVYEPNNSLAFTSTNKIKADANCRHYFTIKLVNGKYVTYCERCGKISEISTGEFTTINKFNPVNIDDISISTTHTSSIPYKSGTTTYSTTGKSVLSDLLEDCITLGPNIFSEKD